MFKRQISAYVRICVAALLLTTACSSNNTALPDESPGENTTTEVPPGMTAAMEMFKTLGSTRSQDRVLEQLVQLDVFTRLVDCVNVEGYSLKLADWPDITPAAPSAREAETTTRWPLLRWYSPVDENFVRTFGLGIENQFLRAGVEDEAFKAFDSSQSALFAEFAAGSQQQAAVLAACIEAADIKSYEDFVPPDSEALRLELEEVVFEVLQREEEAFRSYGSCMASSGFENIDSPSSIFDYFLDATGADPYPSDEAPSESRPAGPTWIASLELEERLALSDASCRREPLTLLDDALLDAVDEVSTRNTEALAGLEGEWESILAEAASQRSQS